MAAPLGQHCQGLPLEVKDIITKARTTWLKNDEVLKLLMHHQKYELPIGKEPPRCPGGNEPGLAEGQELSPFLML